LIARLDNEITIIDGGPFAAEYGGGLADLRRGLHAKREIIRQCCSRARSQNRPLLPSSIPTADLGRALSGASNSMVGQRRPAALWAKSIQNQLKRTSLLRQSTLCCTRWRPRDVTSAWPASVSSRRKPFVGLIEPKLALLVWCSPGTARRALAAFLSVPSASAVNFQSKSGRTPWTATSRGVKRATCGQAVQICNTRWWARSLKARNGRRLVPCSAFPGTADYRCAGKLRRRMRRRSRSRVLTSVRSAIRNFDLLLAIATPLTGVPQLYLGIGTIPIVCGGNRASFCSRWVKKIRRRARNVLSRRRPVTGPCGPQRHQI